MDYDFNGLTPQQQALLTFGGWSPDSKRGQPKKATVRKLIAHSLVVARRVNYGGLSVEVYDVLTPVHMAWCEHCSKICREA